MLYGKQNLKLQCKEFCMCISKCWIPKRDLLILKRPMIAFRCKLFTTWDILLHFYYTNM